MIRNKIIHLTKERRAALNDASVGAGLPKADSADRSVEGTYG